ncbi:MAG: reverse transcriptase domain-containing protein [Sodaliphilus pleomorphus]|uniref:reverse transcriptase domain-containing protein n=1 Tax=Sodaliphilus pleomorphus TaxID=2606626 RepID=UPI002A758429|nr:reverse transcriptase domain-containing protein [Sodaliphilus pleomorphus]MDY2831432.1 reverse transcriptase domain-containing protein [Sodaliphilus pleomorphus]
MEKTKIINRLRKVKTLKGFAKLLNDIKRDEFGTAKYKITEKQLRHFSSPDIFADRYKTFHIRKKSGGVREINAPCYQLKVILYILNKVFKAIYTPSKAAMGFAEERSVVTNASIHTGHHYVFNIDLENFFPSIPQARVWKRLQLAPFNFPIEIANVVAGLCCHKNEDGTKNVLPQGAATSPILTNAICDNLDRRMLGVASRFGLHYTRYADDMTFSSMHNVYQDGSAFRKEIFRIITEQGFTLNEKKTRLQRTGERQEVTGLTVNEKVNVARKYVRDLRCILHVWEKEGYGKAYAYFYPKYKRDKGYIKKGEPVMENVVDGKLNYLRMVKGTNNPTYLKLLERFNKLQTLVYLDKETDKGQSYIYIHSYSLKEFEELFQTTVSLVVSKKGNLIGKCEIAGMEKVIAISKSTQKKLCGNLSEIAPDTVVTSEALKKCFVTLCRAKGKNHWLITKNQMQRSKCLSILNVNIDIDHLLLIWEKLGLEEAVTAFQYCVGGGNLNDFWQKQGLAIRNTSNMPVLSTEDVKSITEQLQSVNLEDIDLDSIESLFEL